MAKSTEQNIFTNVLKIPNKLLQIFGIFYFKVITTCKTDAVSTLESYGLDAVIDYTGTDYSRDIKLCGP